MSKGRFGVHGGQYMPETLMNAVIELEEAYNHYKQDPEFQAELTALLKGMKDVAAEERPVVGQLINDVRAEIETIIDKQKKLLREFEETSTDENQVKRKSFWDKVKDALKDK